VGIRNFGFREFQSRIFNLNAIENRETLFMIDTHSHIYSEDFDADRAETVQRAKDAGITHIILPNCDSGTLPQMLALEAEYPDYFSSAIGLHPTSVKENYREELALIESELKRRNWIAIGEIGIDLYWDKTFLSEQIIAFRQQIDWALKYKLPVIIHVRDSFRETMNALAPYKNSGLTGVFHSFTGTIEEAREIISFGGFRLGINGIVTFKNSGLAAVVAQIDIENLLLETDSPYLTPAPHRGKRNESAYVALVCQKLAEVYSTSTEEIDEQTTRNAFSLFTKLKA
jgi:TatD DNase family protein